MKKVMVVLSCLACLALAAAVWRVCTGPNRTEDVGHGIQVSVWGNCAYCKDDPKAWAKYQFYGWKDTSRPSLSTTLSPAFLLVNNASQPRDVVVRSLADWKSPVAGNVHLEPGQRFKFRIEAVNTWYCCFDASPTR